MFCVVLFLTTKTRNQPKCLVHKRIGKENVRYGYNGKKRIASSVTLLINLGMLRQSKQAVLVSVDQQHKSRLIW